MFKGSVIEVGSYILIGMLVAAASKYLNVDVLVCWMFIIFGMLYSSTIIPLIRRLAWGK